MAYIETLLLGRVLGVTFIMPGLYLGASSKDILNPLMKLVWLVAFYKLLIKSSP